MIRTAANKDWGARLEKLNNPQRLADLPPEQIWSMHALPRVDRMMDLGAGTGLFSLPLARYLPPQGMLLAVDPSPLLTGFIRDQVQAREPRILPLTAWGHALPVGDRFLDLVVMINLYHELDDPRKTLREVRRTLRSGGCLLVVDWREGETSQGPPASHRTGLEQLSGDLRAAGLRPGFPHRHPWICGTAGKPS